jgi:hypothetical protein
MCTLQRLRARNLRKHQEPCQRNLPLSLVLPLVSLPSPVLPLPSHDVPPLPPPFLVLLAFRILPSLFLPSLPLSSVIYILY